MLGHELQLPALIDLALLLNFVQPITDCLQQNRSLLGVYLIELLFNLKDDEQTDVVLTILRHLLYACLVHFLYPGEQMQLHEQLRLHH